MIFCAVAVNGRVSTMNIQSIARFSVALFAPGVLSLALMVGVVAWGNGGVSKVLRPRKPVERKDTHKCNWHCHNHGCRHGMRVVGPPIAGPLVKGQLKGLYGATIRGLKGTGRSRLANLVVFCVVWPLVTGTLWLIVLRQRFDLNALKAAKSREELA
jgi:hypothetical protein